jgi:hypothetical protein
MIYIYGLKCPLENSIRYIGKSTNTKKRLAGHISSALCGQYNHRTARWIRKLSRLSLQPELLILHTVSDGERWQDIEREFISSAGSRGWRLTNSTAGGEGLDFRDPADQAAWRKKLSEKHKKIWGTDERRAEAKARSLKAWADPEITARRLTSSKSAHHRPDVKARNLEVLAEIRANPISQKKKSEAIKANWADPIAGDKRRIALASEDCRSKMSGAAQSRWVDPVKSEKLLAIFGTSESRAKRSDAAKRRSTPEYRAMMAAKTKAAWATGKRNRIEE